MSVKYNLCSPGSYLCKWVYRMFAGPILVVISHQVEINAAWTKTLGGRWRLRTFLFVRPVLGKIMFGLFCRNRPKSALGWNDWNCLMRPEGYKCTSDKDTFKVYVTVIRHFLWCLLRLMRFFLVMFFAIELWRNLKFLNLLDWPYYLKGMVFLWVVLAI